MQWDSFKAKKMAFNGLRLEYALGCTSNLVAWMDHMEVVLDDNGFL